MRRAPPPAEEDAWGSDYEGSNGVGTALSTAKVLGLGPKQLSSPIHAAPPMAWPLPKPADAPPPPSLGPDSLYSICLGVLGEHLEDLLAEPGCCDELLPLLPPPVKACLLAIARLRCLLCDAVLLALADQEQAVLDLHGAGEQLTDGSIRAALRRMPHLRLIDLSSCAVGAATLRALGGCCPGVEVLRLGSPVTDASAGRGLKDVLPVLDQRREAPAADSWDALLAVDDAGQLSVAVAGTSCLMQLQCIHWPNIPFRLAEHCRQVCPKVALNPSSSEVAALRLPPACDPAAQLDAPLLADVSGSQRWERPRGAAQREPVVHIAEKFRLAYISRRQRLAAQREREWQQQRRRELRCTRTEQLIRQWEAEV